MAILNRSTLKQKLQDFINRVAPFDTFSLIQKTEDLEVREDVADSVIFKESTVGSISSPAASFSVDFAVNDEYNINTSASIGSAFTITFSNLKNNSIGKLNITKKSGDTFTFGNGVIVPFNTTTGQTGMVTLTFNVFKVDSNYFVMPLYNYNKEQQVVNKVLEIGNWLMDALDTVIVNHGLTNAEYKNIISANVTIINDANNLVIPLDGTAGRGRIRNIAAGDLTLERDVGGIFDSPDYNGLGNRGFVHLQYILP